MLGGLTVPLAGEARAVASETDDVESSFWCGPLTFKEKLLGFAVCMVCGTLMTLVAFHMAFRSPQKFAVAYSVGNILSFAGITFLVGPARQLEAMAGDKQRLAATSIYLGTLVATVISVYLQLPLLIVAFTLMQWASLLWYSFTYARSVLFHVFSIPQSLLYYFI